jgi:glycosyltransferase involved in cell wall biosynthesis
MKSVRTLAPGPSAVGFVNQERVLVLDEGRGFGGTVVVAATLIRALDTSRFKATLVSAADEQFLATRTQDIQSVVALGPAYTYVHASRLRRICQRLPLIGRLVNFVASKLFSLANIPYLIGIGLVVLRDRITIVHCNNFANLEGLFLAWLLRRPCVLHVHGFIAGAGPITNWFLQRLQPEVIAISQAVADAVSTSGIERERITVIYNPVELPSSTNDSAVHFRRDIGVPEHATLVGIVGRIVEWKGQREFVTACIEVLNTHPAVHAVVVGNASDFDDRYFLEVRETAARSAVGNRIHFTGFVSDTEAMYKSLDILVHASIEPEPFGLVITEAMVHGVAVVAANDGAPREIIDHGETGYLEDPSNASTLAARISMLVEQPELRTQIGESGRLFARHTYNASNYAHSVACVWERAVTRRKTSVDRQKP